MKKALISGVTGQDGAYLAELLLSKRDTLSTASSGGHPHLTQTVLITSIRPPHIDGKNFLLHYGDMTDATNLIRIVQEVQPDEIYNLAAQSHVRVSFEDT